jgi:transcriptional regulator GlxA family with amidase domain
VRIAMVVYDGVLSSECEAFSSVLGLVEGAEMLTVGARPGTYAGPGGLQAVDLTFGEVDRVDVAIVPGGLGCERAAGDPDLSAFLRRMERTAKLLVASSTGSVVLASAGVLHGQPAATHWLAGDLLRRFGSEADARRLVMDANVITCEGMVSAVEAAFAVVEQLEGPGAAARIRATLIERGQPLLRPQTLWQRVLGRAHVSAGVPTGGIARTAEPPAPTPTSAGPPVTPLSVMIELVDNDELRRQLKRSSRHRR